ncbi:MAG TPA: TolC family protein [Blastocatellia bacterium]|nr:TolC family protein [Blastocatellia bacterium]HMX28451.1 TolC family protein [Blastocatellia bacterium]HMY71545.1 TolC family protein [Blastocatellia bacterium]HMZ23057.1 TolC family protein [Blastocatellia bacterium]HNG30620.1 TolC family protein [Blastocatellia bacterium]
MEIRKYLLPQLALTLACVFAGNAVAQANMQASTQTKVSAQTAQTQSASVPALRLEDLEQMALKSNPTLAQAEASIQAAEGRRRQAGLWPNPIVGYEGEGLAFNSQVYPYRNGQYFFVEQSILTGGKLGKSKNIAAQEKVQTQAEAEAQRLRVMNAVRMLYYEAVGAQQQVALRQQLAELTREATEISDELFNTGAADRPDVLAAEVELQRAEIDLLRAQNEYNRVWQVLAAVVNDPQLKPARLEDKLETAAPVLVQDEMLATLLRDSPEMKRALAGIERAKAVVSRAKAEPKPDIFLRGGVGYSNEWAEFFGGKTGWEARVEAGVRVPIFNRNQGNVAASKAELTAAEREVQRVELALRARLADSFTRYQNSLGVAVRYQREVLPRAQRAYELYLAKFRQMGAAYPQVLFTQRTLFQARTEYISSLVELWQNVVQLRGLLLMGGLDAPNGIAGNSAMGAGNN